MRKDSVRSQARSCASLPPGGSLPAAGKGWCVGPCYDVARGRHVRTPSYTASATARRHGSSSRGVAAGKGRTAHGLGDVVSCIHEPVQQRRSDRCCVWMLSIAASRGECTRGSGPAGRHSLSAAASWGATRAEPRRCPWADARFGTMAQRTSYTKSSAVPGDLTPSKNCRQRQLSAAKRATQ